LDRRLPGHNELTLVQTFHYAEKERTEYYIFELIVWLHHLVSRAKNSLNGNKSPIKSPVRSPIKKTANLPATNPENPTPTANGQDKPLLELSEADRDMLKAVNFRKLTPGISKSQEFDTAKLRSIDESTCKLIKSNSHSPTTNTKNEFNGLRRHSTLPNLDFDINRTKALDVIDRVDNLSLL